MVIALAGKQIALEPTPVDAGVFQAAAAGAARARGAGPRVEPDAIAIVGFATRPVKIAAIRAREEGANGLTLGRRWRRWRRALLGAIIFTSISSIAAIANISIGRVIQAIIVSIMAAFIIVALPKA